MRRSAASRRSVHQMTPCVRVARTHRSLCRTRHRVLPPGSDGRTPCPAVRRCVGPRCAPRISQAAYVLHRSCWTRTVRVCLTQITPLRRTSAAWKERHGHSAQPRHETACRNSWTTTWIPSGSRSRANRRSEGSQPHSINIHFPKRTAVTVCRCAHTACIYLSGL